MKVIAIFVLLLSLIGCSSDGEAPDEIQGAWKSQEKILTRYGTILIGEKTVDTSNDPIDVTFRKEGEKYQVFRQGVTQPILNIEIVNKNQIKVRNDYSGENIYNRTTKEDVEVTRSAPIEVPADPF